MILLLLVSCLMYISLSSELKEEGRRSRRSSTASGGRRSRLGSECLEMRNILADRIQTARELRGRLNSLRGDSSMKTSFDIGEFLEEKDLDITGKNYKDIFPLSSGAEAEDLTSKFLYAVVEILLDFINQTNDRDASVLDFHHPSQITKAMDFSLPDTVLSLDQLVLDCRAALRTFW